MSKHDKNEKPPAPIEDEAPLEVARPGMVRFDEPVTCLALNAFGEVVRVSFALGEIVEAASIEPIDLASLRARKLVT